MIVEKQLQTFLTVGPYLVRIEELEQREHLEEAHHKLQRLEDRYGSQANQTSPIARIKYLLGHDDFDVETLLKKSVETNTGSKAKIQDKMNTYILLGRFYEKTNEKEKAKEMYEKAMEIQGLKGGRRLAKHRLKVLSASCAE